MKKQNFLIGVLLAVVVVFIFLFIKEYKVEQKTTSAIALFIICFFYGLLWKTEISLLFNGKTKIAINGNFFLLSAGILLASFYYEGETLFVVAKLMLAILLIITSMLASPSAK